MTAAEWGVWIGYEIVVAVVVYTKSVFWFRRPFRVTGAGRESLVGRHVHPSVLRAWRMQTALQSWLTLLMLAFFAAIGLSQWLETSSLAALIAYGLASGIIVTAAVNAACEVGLRLGERLHDTQAQKPKDE